MKSLKLKSENAILKWVFIFMFISIITAACDDSITISKQEYNQLKGIKSPTYPKPVRIDYQDWSITLGSDGHEYCDNNRGNGYVCFHYIDCVKCKKDTIKLLP